VKLRSKILFVLAVLPIFVVLFLLPHGGHRRDLENYKKALIAKGEKLTIAELAPPPSANPSNGAEAFMQFMSNYTPPADYPPMMKLVAPGLAAIGSTNDAALLTNHYAENIRKMAELRTTLNMAILDFDLDYSKGFHLLLPHLDQLKRTEKLAAGSAMQALYAGNYSEVRSDLLTAADLIRLFPNEPFMISDLVRIAMAQIAISATWEALQSGEWTDPQLAELEQKWNGVNFFNGCEQTLSRERAEAIAGMKELRETSYSNFVAATTMPWGGSGNSGSTTIQAAIQEKMRQLYDRSQYWQWKSSWSYDEELFCLQLSEAELESARSANSTGSFAPAFNRLNQERDSLVQLHPDGVDHFMVFGQGLGGWSIRYLQQLAGAETVRRLTVTAIALKRYHLQHGVYPATLDDLVPAFLSALPADFMDGKPLRYKLRPDGDFLLYSVGEDGVDNGGDPTPVPPAASTINWLAGRDIVWPRVATPAALAEYQQTATNAVGR
jgi:hypothetical protein